MFIGNKSLIPKFFIYRKKKKEVDKKQKEVDQNNCEMEGTLVKETITFLKTDGTLFNQLNNPQNLRRSYGLFVNNTIFCNSDTR